MSYASLNVFCGNSSWPGVKTTHGGVVRAKQQRESGASAQPESGPCLIC